MPMPAMAPPTGDGLELRHDGRHQINGERFPNEIFIGRKAFDFRKSFLGIN